MVTLATAEMPEVMACSWELERDRPSYTIETLEGLSRQNPGNRYCFIAGGDSLKEVHLWREYGRLLREFNFVFVERVGIETDLNQISLDSSLKKQFRIVCEDHKETLHPGTSYLVRAQPPAVSSTKIRADISSGHYPDRDEISGRVLNYIRKHQLYE
jgi:nicotinate-nucleotide adenylyltransferase